MIEGIFNVSFTRRFMKGDDYAMYTVEDIATMLNVNKETVRRWIRSGKLESAMLYSKKGRVRYIGRTIK